MKWPESLTLIRHDESAYNALKKSREADPLYQLFKQAFDQNPTSSEAKRLALEIKQKTSLGKGDHDTPLAVGAGHQTVTMAKRLRGIIELPDIVHVSPYERTIHTYRKMVEGWPELRDIKIVEEERIREQEHGLALLYNDWRIFYALHPEQMELHNIEGNYYYRYPQGESVADVRERTRSWLNTLTRDFAGQHVLAVTHHLTILAVRANLERLSAQQFMDLDNFKKPINAGVTIYRGRADLGADGKLILDQYNLKLY